MLLTVESELDGEPHWYRDAEQQCRLKPPAAQGFHEVLVELSILGAVSLIDNFYFRQAAILIQDGLAGTLS